LSILYKSSPLLLLLHLSFLLFHQPASVVEPKKAVGEESKAELPLLNLAPLSPTEAALDLSFLYPAAEYKQIEQEAGTMKDDGKGLTFCSPVKDC
jgi:hypothetical protein